ncbi:membrane protein [Sphingobium sp. TomMM35A]|jgi:putative integral membrane protein (TIGR02587 family)|uniref:TIGR02587 family membrane protein n=1 Tax=Novosphingobium sp. Chol11 TaxID=1385763 RepID=UPI000BE3A204|nr:TIGR02587 family membrane protein [Novosphingobium sp. Chol11]
MTALWDSDANWGYARGVARALAGAVLFGLPLLMTMEMWSLGMNVEPRRLALFLLANFLLLVILSRFGGFEPTSSVTEDILDALAAYAIGMVASTAVLFLLALANTSIPPDEMLGMIAIQSIPTSFGAMITRKQFSAGGGESEEDQEARTAGYAGQLFLMMAGALFLAFNIAPTEEVLLIAFKMTPWHSLALAGVSLFVLHALVFNVGLTGQEAAPEGYGAGRVFLIFTVPGYAIAILMSLYVLWTFGRLDHGDLASVAESAAVLGFPASIGAAIARLVV